MTSSYRLEGKKSRNVFRAVSCQHVHASTALRGKISGFCEKPLPSGPKSHHEESKYDPHTNSSVGCLPVNHNQSDYHFSCTVLSTLIGKTVRRRNYIAICNIRRKIVFSGLNTFTCCCCVWFFSFLVHLL